MDIKIIPLDPEQKREAPAEDFGFGNLFVNRMFTQYWDQGVGWHDAQIGPFQDFSLSPATAALHYAQEIFEGTKVYRRPDGDLNLFRPWENMKRFNLSAKRMAMPQIDEEEHLEAIIKLIEMEAEWVPSAPGATLYVRPAMFASEPFLGVHASTSYIHFVIAGPVGAYFKEGFNPVPVYISDKYRRAVRGGVGAAKTGGNYAASLFVSEEAAAKGYSQVLWLDATDGRFVEEVGAMNICFVYEGRRIVTPPLSDSILAGVTRDSVLTLAPDLGYEVAEVQIDVHEMLADVRSGKISEVFGCGTAAVIAPVGMFEYRNEIFTINNNESGPVATELFNALTGIQYGRAPDPYGWTLRISGA